MTSNLNTEDLASRLERLEKNYVWWKRTGIVASIATAVMLAVTAHAYSQRQASPPAAPVADGANAAPVDDKGVTLTYTNFFRVTGTPEELIIDFGLNSQQQAANGQEPVKLSNRTVMSFYTAKRLLNALQWAVNRYETTFGELETDYKKRMRANPALDKP